MTVKWFFSKTVREASAMRKHVWKLLSAQRDILSPQAIEALEAAVDEMRKTLEGDAGPDDLKTAMANLETAANKWLKPYPHPAWRENVEVLLVALAVAMGIRTFFLQPFKIPTGSMQPTLWGVTSSNLIDQPGYQIPTGLARARDWLAGASYLHVRAKVDGPLEAVEEPTRILIFNISQKLVIGGVTHTIWFPPDYGAGKLADRAGLRLGKIYRQGEDVVKLRVNCGDHLFVDRLTYNFRRPERGEIIVFETKGIHDPLRRVPPDQYYIKRLVALGGEHVRIGDDHHLIINGKRLDASTPRFENVYSFPPNPGENQYDGHELTHDPDRSFLYDDKQEYTVQKDHVMVMGDNTRNSLDSRYFGDFSREYVIGKSWFVYWPITTRFGLGYR